MELTAADYVGLVAAYLDRSFNPADMRKDLSGSLSSHVINRMVATFHTFEDQSGNGLWIEGALGGDFQLSHPRLIELYPGINANYHRHFERQ